LFYTLGTANALNTAIHTPTNLHTQFIGIRKRLLTEESAVFGQNFNGKINRPTNVLFYLVNLILSGVRHRDRYP
jgi:hypothetical protein